MKELNLRKKKFYSSAIRSLIWLVFLLILLAITNINIAKAFLTLLIIGILFNFAFVAETQLPFIVSKVPQSGLIISSAIHIVVIFVTYINLLEVVTERNAIRQVFNAVFLLLLCIPLFRGGKALYEGIDSFANESTKVFDGLNPSFALKFVVCPQCGTENDLNAKHCIECGTNLTKTTTEKETIKKIQFSVAHPLAVSKRFDSIFLCQIYLQKSRSRALKNIKSKFQDKRFDEQTNQSLVKYGQKVMVKLERNNFSFTEPTTKLINDSLIEFVIQGRPNDSCESGNHSIKASVIDTVTGEELDYLILKRVRVVDFAFGHISRPLLSKTSTVVLGIGSFAMFILTFLEQIDKTIGLTSGTAVGVLAAVIYANFYNLYQRIHPNSP